MTTTSLVAAKWHELRVLSIAVRCSEQGFQTSKGDAPGARFVPGIRASFRGGVTRQHSTRGTSLPRGILSHLCTCLRPDLCCPACRVLPHVGRTPAALIKWLRGNR